MPVADVVVESSVNKTFRVQQIAGMFDVAFEDKMRHEWHVDLPIEDKPWLIGAIVGPSGSGKTVIGRTLFEKQYHRGFRWPKDKCVLDAFDDNESITEVTTALTSVGFSSPPSWAKPFHVLSNGEKFRVELARLLQSKQKLVVVDEFTSVVDRTVAKIGSAALSKTLRRRNDMQLIVLSCHYDILEWLAPDWIFDLRDGTFQWAHLQRPTINIDIHKVPSAVWQLFAHHHYLNTSRLPAAQAFLGTWNEQPVGVVMVMPSMGKRRMWREARCVVLPDYQGLGIGGRLSDAVGQFFRDKGDRYVATASHPALVAYWNRSPRWRLTNIRRNGAPKQSGMVARMAIEKGIPVRTSQGRAVVSVEYVGV